MGDVHSRRSFTLIWKQDKESCQRPGSGKEPGPALAPGKSHLPVLAAGGGTGREWLSKEGDRNQQSLYGAQGAVLGSVRPGLRRGCGRERRWLAV